MKISINCILVMYLCSISFVRAQDSIRNYFPEKDFEDFRYSFTDMPPMISKLKNISDKPDPFNNEIDYGMLAGAGSVMLATGIGVHIYQANAWWKDQRSHFRFVNDWNYALWIDKIGHFYGANIIAHFISSGLEASNMTDEQSAMYGAIGALIFDLYVEIEDGFGPNWGFSPGDAVSDVIGSAYFLSQYYFPVLKNFQPRFSYFPSKEFREGLRKDGNFLDDYHGQKYWMAFRMKELLPKSISKFWPSFLMISAGMGVKDLDGSGGGTREFYISLDFDPGVIPLHGKFWQFLKNSFDYIHFPMPGIRVSPNAAFFVFCY